MAAAPRAPPPLHCCRGPPPAAWRTQQPQLLPLSSPAAPLLGLPHILSTPLPQQPLPGRNQQHSRPTAPSSSRISSPARPGSPVPFFPAVYSRPATRISPWLLLLSTCCAPVHPTAAIAAAAAGFGCSSTAATTPALVAVHDCCVCAIFLPHGNVLPLSGYLLVIGGFMCV